MAVTARSWVEGELVNAAKMNTIRDDLLELEDVAGFENAQYGTITIANGNATGTATIAAVSARAVAIMNGYRTTETTNQNSSPTLTKTNATTLTAERAGTSGTVVVGYVVTESRG